MGVLCMDGNVIDRSSALIGDSIAPEVVPLTAPPPRSD
jgi:hypothetical protein